MRAAMTEADMQRGILEAATLGRWRSYHTFDSRRSNPGFPDLVLVRPPVAGFFELKGPGGRVSPAQAEWIEALTDCEQIIAGVVRPAGYAALCRLLVRPWARAQRISRALLELGHGQ